jgi:hypothetical protein
MCGIAGLFVGCAAFPVCPMHALRGAGEPAEPSGAGSNAEPEYRSPFTNWYESASVRRAPRRLLETDGSRQLLFSPAMVPLARHPLVRDLPEEIFGQILTQHLYRYLDFTRKLEHLVVNRTVLGIAQGMVGVEVPEEMALDAYKIYCDEACHALFAADLLHQARQRTRLVPLLERQPYFLQRLAAIQEEVGNGLEPLVELLFVVCSETLISATLAEVPDDRSVATAVQETIRDHALDEGRHHMYFAAFLRVLWFNLTPRVRREMGVLIPELIDAFLTPDIRVMRVELAGYGFGRDDIEQIVGEVFTDEIMRSSAASIACRTVRHFKSVGALEDPATMEAFAAHDLLSGGPARHAAQLT